MLELCWENSIKNGLRLLWHLSWKNIIASDSEIIKACESDDVQWVRDLFMGGGVLPNDMTSDSRPLLWV